jgi:hypothetical protein
MILKAAQHERCAAAYRKAAAEPDLPCQKRRRLLELATRAEAMATAAAKLDAWKSAQETADEG